MSDYSNSPKTEVVDKPVEKKKREGVKMSDKQKSDLNKHMSKVGKDMSASEKRSHRMKMMSRMRKGMSVGKAHKDIK